MKPAFITIALTAAVLAGCTAVEQLIKPPSVDVEGVKISGLSFQEIELDLALLIRNPNPFGVQLNGFEYALIVQQHQVLSGEKNQTVRLAGANQSRITIPVTLIFSDLRDLIKEAGDLDSLAYQVRGHFKPGGVLAGMNVPFSASGSLPNIRPPRLGFSGLRVAKMGLTGVDLELVLDLENRNSFSYALGQLDYEIALAGESVASGSTRDAAEIPSRGSTEIRLPLSLNFSAISSSLLSLLRGDRIDCSVNGGAELTSPFGALDLPIAAQQTLDILK